MRRFWYDELFTYQMSQMPGMTGVWAALMGGADLNPPLGYAFVKVSQLLFGNGELATRLPSLIGFFVMALCLYRFIARRSSALLGYVAAMVPLCSGAYYLASEARPYGLMLGFAGLALVCWQEATIRSKRGWFLAGFTLSLAAALMSHCYAVLIFLPFGFAEIVRQYRERTMDWKMWAALVAPMGCVAVYFPLFANLTSYTLGNYSFRVQWTAIPEVYERWLTPLLWPAAAGALLLAAPALGKPVREEPRHSVQWHEWAIAAGFAIIPAAAVLLAKVLNSQFYPRYGAMGVLGLSLLLGLFLRWRNTNTKAATLVVAAFLCCYVASFGGWVYGILADAQTSETAPLSKKERRQAIDQIRPELPFVAASALEFLELDHYSKPEFAKRLYYLSDRDAELEYTQSDILAGGFPVMEKWFKMRGLVVRYQSFIQKHPRFLLYGPYACPNDWLIKKLIDDGAVVSLINDAPSMYGDNLLFEVTIR